MDAVTTAKDRIDKALASLERKVMDLKARAAGVGEDEGLFALPSSADAAARIAELEEAGADAVAALSRAADAVRATLNERG